MGILPSICTKTFFFLNHSLSSGILIYLYQTLNIVPHNPEDLLVLFQFLKSLFKFRLDHFCWNIFKFTYLFVCLFNIFSGSNLLVISFLFHSTYWLLSSWISISIPDIWICFISLFFTHHVHLFLYYLEHIYDRVLKSLSAILTSQLLWGQFLLATPFFLNYSSIFFLLLSYLIYVIHIYLKHFMLDFVDML